MHPRVAGGLRRAGVAARRLTRRATAWRRRVAGPDGEPDALGRRTALGRVFAAPWYPWPASVIPILHFLASNPLHFAVPDAVVPMSGMLLVVTVAVSGLRLVLKDWRQAAAAVTAVTAVLFGYGHVERALDGRLDEHTLFPCLGRAFRRCCWDSRSKPWPGFSLGTVPECYSWHLASVSDHGLGGSSVGRFRAHVAV